MYNMLDIPSCNLLIQFRVIGITNQINDYYPNPIITNNGIPLFIFYKFIFFLALANL